MEIIQPLPYQAYKCIFNILRLLPKCLICKHFLVLCPHFCLLEKPLMLLAKCNSDFRKQQNTGRESSHSWYQQFSTLAYPSYHPHKPTPADGPTLQISRIILLTCSHSCSQEQKTHLRCAECVLSIADHDLLPIDGQGRVLSQQKIMQLFGWGDRVELQQGEAEGSTHVIPDHLGVFDGHGGESGDGLEHPLLRR